LSLPGRTSRPSASPLSGGVLVVGVALLLTACGGSSRTSEDLGPFQPLAGDGQRADLTAVGSSLVESEIELLGEIAQVEGFAGVHLDAAHGLVISVTPTGLDEVRRLAAGLPPDAHLVVEVRHSAAELDAAQERILGAADELEASGVTVDAVYVDVATNQLHVAVSRGADVARQRLAELTPLPVVVEGPLEVVPAAG
jgi:hypothetical protein